jgi:thioesterase domain-containing protein
MTGLEPEREDEETAELRNAAVEALQSAVRQQDPKESDRLTRYALALIDRARAIRQRGRAISKEGRPVMPDARRRKEDPGPGRKSMAEFIGKLRRFYSRRRRR